MESGGDATFAGRARQRLSTLLLHDDGYKFILPALVLFETTLSAAAILKVPFTEIDFQTYIGQANLFLHGERDYSKLDPPGGSGPCVYPAAHIYFYSLMSRLTSSGSHLLPAQILFAALLISTLVAVAALYRKAGAPPILLIGLSLSKRLHSIFLLRMFNDPVAIFLVYCALNFACSRRWNLASILLSLAIGIKMNVLLFLPAYFVALFSNAGFKGLSSSTILILAVQAALSIPFIQNNPKAYLSRSFDLSRQFLYEWTVNWRLVPEPIFLSQQFSRSLIGAHLCLLVLFGIFKWTGLARHGFAWITRKPDAARGLKTQDQIAHLLTILFTANVIGLLCSRSLHYQFYSWYFHQVPFLLWRSPLPLLLKVSLPVALEWSWNVFPSTKESSAVLLLVHLALVSAAWTSPSSSSELRKHQKPKIGQDHESDEEDAFLVDNMLSSGTLKESERSASPESELDEQGSPDTANEEEAKQSSEDRLLQSFRRRLVLRRKLSSIISKISPAARFSMVLASVSLLAMVPYPQSPLSKGVYVDENALQPGQARVHWDYLDVTYADMLAEKVAKVGRNGTAFERAELIRSELASYGLSPRTQSFAYTKAPLAGQAPPSGINIYARSASPRIDGREAVILTASWKSRWTGLHDPFAGDTAEPDSTDELRTNVRGIAILLTLARYLQTQNFLSKDLIFVISDGYLEGIQAWSSAFFGDMPRDLKAESIEEGGSQIWNAITIDYPSDSFSSLAVSFEGIDGQSPNMDSLNTLLRITERVDGRVPITLLGEDPRFSHVPDVGKALAASGIDKAVENAGVRDYELRAYTKGLQASLHQWVHGASGQTTGAHGLFQRYHVDAITVFAVPAKGPYGFYHLGRIIESYVRSLSNLLERLHHSQFIYLLVSPRNFVPIGVVIFIPLLVAISMTFAGLSIWFREEKVSTRLRAEWLTLHESTAGQTQQDDAVLEVVPVAQQRMWLTQNVLNSTNVKVEAAGSFDSIQAGLEACSRPFQAALFSTLAAFGAGLGLLWHASVTFSTESFREQEHLLLAVLALAALAPFGVAIALKSCSAAPAYRISNLIQAFTLLQAGMTVAVMSTLNFAFATALGFSSLAVINVGKLGLSRDTKRQGRISLLSVVSVFVRYTMLLAISPVALIAIAQNPSPQVGGLRQVLLSAIYDWKVVGTKAIPLVYLLIYPIIFQTQVSLSSYLM